MNATNSTIAVVIEDALVIKLTLQVEQQKAYIDSMLIEKETYVAPTDVVYNAGIATPAAPDIIYIEKIEEPTPAPIRLKCMRPKKPVRAQPVQPVQPVEDDDDDESREFWEDMPDLEDLEEYSGNHKLFCEGKWEAMKTQSHPHRPNVLRLMRKHGYDV